MSPVDRPVRPEGDDAVLRHAQQQMLMSRPWDTAEPDSIWEITGEYPATKHSFTGCLAVVLPGYVHDSDRPLFEFVGALAAVNRPVDAAWITHAVPLLLVHRTDPGTTYWQGDAVWLRRTEDQ